MYKIGSYEGFKIFEPSLQAAADTLPVIERARFANNEFLKYHPVSEQPPMRISGSFVYAHAPDYTGSATLDWGEADWHRLFAEMRSAGIDTVILQASLWNELNEVYYKSEYFSAYRQWNVVEPMLLAARREKIRVFLGGYGSCAGWTRFPDDNMVREEIDRQFRCFNELLTYRELFEGVYFTPETAFAGERNPGRERWQNRLYREYFSRVKECVPDKAIVMSPASKYIPGCEAEAVEFWDRIFAGVPLDILAPQDSIGIGICTLENQQAMWRQWRETADSLQMALWANVELFEREKFGGAVPFHAASPSRVRAQLANVAPFVEKCICWEYQYFAGKARGGEEIRKEIFPPVTLR